MRPLLYRDNTGGYGRKVHLGKFAPRCGVRSVSHKQLTLDPEQVDCARCLQLMQAKDSTR